MSLLTYKFFDDFQNFSANFILIDIFFFRHMSYPRETMVKHKEMRKLKVN